MTAYYGLPEKVLFCARCVISNQRPASVVEYQNVPSAKKATIAFDAEGVCDACRVAEAKASLDWTERERRLRELCAEHRSKDGSWDCVVPGSGGKDSFYAAHVLKNKYGMHPLLCTWAPHMPTDWGWRNLQRWQAVGDHIMVTPNRRTHALITRLAVEELFHPFQPFIVGQKSLAAKIALQYDVPLVFYGESESEYGNPKADIESPQRAKSYHAYVDELHLGGVPAWELKQRYGLTEADLAPYLPADLDRIVRRGVEVHYLGFYLKWHPQSAYYYSSEHGGFEAAPERTPGTYSKYNSIDDKIDDFHYWTTYQKFGIGRATYDAAQEIRSGDIDRPEGVALVRKFDGEWPGRFAGEINAYLSVPGFAPMTVERWVTLAEKFRSPHLWDGDQLRCVVS